MHPDLAEPVEVRRPKRSRFVVRKFQCDSHNEFEVLVEDRERFNPQKCPKCKKKCESVFIATRSALPAATIVYEKMVDGKIQRMYVDPQVPESCAVAEKQGYQKREIQGMAQARAFEKEVATEMRREFIATQNAASRQKEEALREAHAELRSMMPQMDDFSRAIAEEAIRESQSGYSREYDPNFRIGAYS